MEGCSLIVSGSGCESHVEERPVPARKKDCRGSDERSVSSSLALAIAEAFVLVSFSSAVGAEEAGASMPKHSATMHEGRTGSAGRPESADAMRGGRKCSARQEHVCIID